MRRSAFPVFAFLLFAMAANAQKVELAVVGGGLFVSGSGATTTGASAAIEGSIAVSAIHFASAGLYFELPIAAGTSASATSSEVCGTGCTTIARSASPLFVTPGLKLKLGAPVVPVSAFVGAGIGVARYSQTAGGTSSGSLVNFAFQYGGGVDFKAAPFVSLRGEVRDYVADGPFGGPRQHNILAGAGLVLRF